jgi:poly-gamma-glutamate synthesis protein (capsule biosynthesis protein)
MGLLRGSNASFGNLETTIVDLREPGVHPWSVPEDDTVRAEPACATDLKAMGFSLLGRANNHGMDWGVGGLLATTRHLDEAGLVHAGAGVSASAARAPAYLETPQGRVALVSLTTSPSHEAAPATDPSGTVPARPGVATIRVKATVTLPPEGMELLEALRDLYPESDSNWTSPREPLTESDVFMTRFVAGPGVGVSYQADEKDVRAAMRAVRLGAQHADLCMVAIHANQVSREVIAAAFPDHESVTDADLQSVLSDDFEVEAFFESALAVTRFEAGAVSEVRLHPVELGYGLGLTRKGIPRRAPAEAAGEILKRVAAMSAPFGTAIELEGEHGVIRP